MVEIKRPKTVGKKKQIRCFLFANYIEEGSRRPIQSPNNGRKKKVKFQEEREMRSSSFVN